MITCYLWVLPANDPPSYSPRDQWMAICPDHTEVNANTPVENDPDGQNIRAMIVGSYNQQLTPDPAATVEDFEFVDPPPDYEWPV